MEIAKGKANAEKMEQNSSKKKHCADKTMPKKSRTDLFKSVKCIEPTLLPDDVWSIIEEQFSDSKLSQFVEKLFKILCI